MARTKNEESYTQARKKLLSAGLNLIRSNSYAGTGVSDVLKYANVPKGSFYHYFSSKEEFGVEVSKYYNEKQLLSARNILILDDKSPIDRLKAYFQTAYNEFESYDFSQGCLMCNLSTELPDHYEAFKLELEKHWDELSSIIAECLVEVDKSEIGLSHLSDKEAADWLLNAWSGALTRMKAVRNGSPLKLFLKSTFKKDG